MKPNNNAILVAFMIILVAGTGIVVANQLRELPQRQPSLADPVNVTQVSTIMPASPGASSAGTPFPVNLTEDVAVAQAREAYSSWYTIAAVNLTDRYPGKILYEFSLIPKDRFYHNNLTVYINAATGDPYNPLEELAGITIDQAKARARDEFPQWHVDRVKMMYHDGSNYNRAWSFDLYHNDERLVQGGLNPDTGELAWYAIGIRRNGRPETPSVSMESAEKTAMFEIRKRNGDLPVTLSQSRYDPLGMPGEKIAGVYVFVYNRVIRDVPCDSDGIVISVDSVAGTVDEYRKSWSLPENAVAVSSQPVITKAAAIKTVETEAAKIYPASAAGLKIVSADLRWKDFHNPDKIVPAPGSIPLAWKVRFDDESIRAQQWPNPATGWVDAQSGTLIDMYYRHQ